MGLSFSQVTIPFITFFRSPFPRANQSSSKNKFQGEAGEAVINLLLVVTAASVLFLGLFSLNRAYERKTKEHLNDFQKRWNRLEERYQD